jgi:hypothetical protein
MAIQAFNYIVVRLGSVFATFLIFSIIGRMLPDTEASAAYFFSFILGFCLATSRTCCQVASSINGSDRISEKVRSVKKGYILATYSSVLLGIIGSVLISKITNSYWIPALSFLVILLGGLNVDVLRGALNRSSIFPVLFALGSLVSLVCMQWVFPPSLDWIIFCLFLQWIFVILFNGKLLIWIFSSREKIDVSVFFLFYVFSISSFDGLIVNAAFLGILDPSSEAAVEISVIVRVFISSLPLLPLLMHWTNSRAFNDFCLSHGISVRMTFLMMVLVTGIFSGVLFIFMYSYIAGKAWSGDVVVGYLALLVAYGFFITEVRFSVQPYSAKVFRPVVIIVIVVVFFLSMISIDKLGLLSVLNFISAQCFTLIFAALFLKKFGG